MKIILIVDGGFKIHLDCKNTTIERIQELARIHKVDDVIYTK